MWEGVQGIQQVRRRLMSCLERRMGVDRRMRERIESGWGQVGSGGGNRVLEGLVSQES